MIRSSSTPRCWPTCCCWPVVGSNLAPASDGVAPSRGQHHQLDGARLALAARAPDRARAASCAVEDRAARAPHPVHVDLPGAPAGRAVPALGAVADARLGDRRRPAHAVLRPGGGGRRLLLLGLPHAHTEGQEGHSPQGVPKPHCSCLATPGLWQSASKKHRKRNSAMGVRPVASAAAACPCR